MVAELANAGLPAEPPTPEYRSLLESCTGACMQTRYVDPRTGRLAWGTWHDPTAHGAVCTSCLMEGNGSYRVVKTGPLEIDLRACLAAVRGEIVALTRREWQILEALALEIGALVPYEQILTRVWGRGQMQAMYRRSGDVFEPRASHPLRVNLARLRPKLGPAAKLIETVPQMGLRLKNVPPTGDHHDD